MAKAFEMSFTIGGKIASSFSNAFNKAGSSLESLKNQSRQTQRALDQLNNDFRKGKIHQNQYTESTERLTRELAQLERQQNRINTFKGNFANGLQTVKTAAGVAVLGTAAAATGVAVNTLKKSMNFEKEMTKTSVLAGASAEEMKKLNATALDLSGTSSKTASEVAEAMGALGAKGMDANKIMGAMPGILAASEASGEDLALTSDVVTSALNAYGMEASKASHIADVMAMSANATAAGVEDLGYSFKYAAPVANTLGISLEELATATGVMVDKGLSGEQAGTSLRMALIRLSSPPKEATKALDKLGISVVDKNKKFKSMAQISKEWNEATKDLTQTQKVQYASTVFGTEAATGMLNLFASGPEKIGSMTKALEESTGSAKAAAVAMKDNLGGAVTNLESTVEAAQIKFAQPSMPVLQSAVEGVTRTINDNMASIESAGVSLSKKLEKVFAPFIAPTQEEMFAMKHQDPEAYQQALSKYNEFNNTGLADKMVASFDIALDEVSNYLDGPGGDKVQAVMTKMGEIAAQTWWSSFTNTVKSAGANIAEGNFGTGLGLTLAATMMGGGLLAKGAFALGKGGFNAGKGIYNKVKGAKGTPAPGKAVPKATPKTVPKTSKGGGVPKNTPGKVVPFPQKEAKAAKVSKGFKMPKFLTKAGDGIKAFGGKALKVAGKAALPVAIVSETINTVKSKDKVKAGVSGASGVAGGVGGAKLGAMAGTAIAPGIGTVIGGFLGGVGGYIGGKWFGGKAVDKTRQATNNAPAQGTPKSNKAPGASTEAITKANKTFTDTAKKISETGTQMTTSFTSLKTSVDKVKGDMDKLSTLTSQATGWLASLSNIKTASDKVVSALSDLESRIRAVEVPSASKRTAMK